MPSSIFTSDISRRWLLAGVAVVASLAGVALYAVGVLQSLQNAAIDESFTLRGARPPSAGIVIVAVDNYSLGRINSQLPIPRSDYARLLDVLHRASPRLIGLDLQFIGASLHPEQDRALLGAFARDGPVLVSVTDNGTGVPTIVGVRNPRGVVPASGAVDTDSDGVLRKLMYVQLRIPTFAIRAAEMLRGRPVRAAQVPGNHAWIDFAGPPGTYPIYSMAKVLDAQVPPSAFAGKVVLVGITAPIGKDVFTTSASPNPMSGVEVQANSIETVLRGFPLQSSSLILSLAVIIALAVVPVLLSFRVNALIVGLISIALAILYLAVVEFAFTRGLILPVPDAILALGLATVGCVAADAFIDRRQLRNLRRTFDLDPSPVGDFFISYRRGQSELASNTLREALARKWGDKRVFMDTEAIDYGDEWPARLEEAVAACRAMLVVIGPQWLSVRAPDGSRRLDDERDWVRREITGAFERGVIVVPVLHDGAQAPREDELPGPIKPLGRCEAVPLTGRDLDHWIAHLDQSIQQARVRRARRLGTAAI